MTDVSNTEEKTSEQVDSRASPVMRRQLSNLGFLSTSPDSSDTDTVFDVAVDCESSDDETTQHASSVMCDASELCEGLASWFITRLTSFVKRILELRMLSAINQLYDMHQRCLNVMIDSTFVAANEVTCTPARLKYARDQEVRLLCCMQLIVVLCLEQVWLDILCRRQNMIHKRV